MTTPPPEVTPDEADSWVDVYTITDPEQIEAEAPHKAGAPLLYVMHDGANPNGLKLYFTKEEWEAFVLGVKDGEFDLDESGHLPLPALGARGLNHRGPHPIKRDNFQQMCYDSFNQAPPA